jgi:hypothetical protein
MATTTPDARRRWWVKLVLVLAVQGLAAAALFEGIIALYFAHPVRLEVVRTVARRIYATADRDIIQFNTAFARYDPELLYTLRPGRFVWGEREFSTRYEVNSLGVRDTEDALTAPEIVVAGDSVAMGWGVEQDQTFAAVIRQRTGRRVLNTGVSSYGTAREMRLLDRIDRRAVRWLIVQYNANDVGENRVFAANGNRHLGSSRVKYERTIERAQARRRYYPGRYVLQGFTLLERDLRQWIFPPPPRGPAPTADEETEWFVNALMHAGPADLVRARLVLFELSADGVVNPVIPTLRARIAAGRVPAPLREAIVLDVPSRLHPDDFWVLDGHPKAHAHRLVADAILAAMGPSP